MTHHDGWFQHRIDIQTQGRGSIEITDDCQHQVADSAVRTGLCHVFIQHTSASLMICENADPEVLRDLEYFMSRMVPDGDPGYRHSAEGSDDMAAHIRTVLTSSSLNLPIQNGRLALGVWQGIYLWEHRTKSHRRQVLVTVQGGR